jgi:hypothetical protein
VARRRGTGSATSRGDNHNLALSPKSSSYRIRALFRGTPCRVRSTYSKRPGARDHMDFGAEPPGTPSARLLGRRRHAAYLSTASSRLVHRGGENRNRAPRFAANVRPRVVPACRPSRAHERCSGSSARLEWTEVVQGDQSAKNRAAHELPVHQRAAARPLSPCRFLRPRPNAKKLTSSATLHPPCGRSTTNRQASCWPVASRPWERWTAADGYLGSLWLDSSVRPRWHDGRLRAPGRHDASRWFVPPTDLSGFGSWQRLRGSTAYF